MDFDTLVLILCVAFLASVAWIVHQLRRGPRLVLLAGTAAMVFQVFCPYCIQPDGTSARTWMSAGTGYRESSAIRVDVGRQAAWLLSTLAPTVAGCAALEWRLRRRAEAASPHTKVE